MLEIFSSAVFLGVGSIILSISQDVVRGVLLGLLFIITALATKIIAQRHPPVTKNDKNFLPLKQQDANQNQKSTIGIIDFVWVFIMGGSLAIIGFTVGVSPFTDNISEGMKNEYYQKSIDTTMFLLGKTIDFVTVLGGTLAACMGIIWAGEIWRKDRIGHQYKSTKLSSIKMVIAFFVVILNLLVWIGVPLYNRMLALVDFLK